MGFLSGLLKNMGKTKSSSSNNGNKGNNKNLGDRAYRGPYKEVDIERKEHEYDGAGIYKSRESLNGRSLIDVPAWGYKDFINERLNFQKGIDSGMTNPGWFYFKIFFKFDTKFGLLGGILNEDGQKMGADNTAIQYLHRNQKRCPIDNSDYTIMHDRKLALIKFVKTLSYISSHAPWFFASVKDVNSALTMDLNNLTAQKSIEIECMEEATDMRLMTLMDLYKFAAYDNINQKEVIPENLRKFDLDIVVFQAPIRYLHTSSRDLKGRSTLYKNLNATNYSDRMSFKLFTFQGCEIDYNSLKSMLPQTFVNDKPFESKPSFKINYDRVYQHNQNEFAKILFGDTGFFWSQNSMGSVEYNGGKNEVAIKRGDILVTGDDSNVGTRDKLDDNNDNEAKRISMMKYANDNKYYYNPASQTYKTLVDATESTISAAMMLIDGQAGLGNLYGDTSKWTSGLKSIVDSTKDAYKNTWKNGVKNFLQF